MRHLSFAGLGMIWALVGLTAQASVQLDIPPRRQWNNGDGYCGECTIQQIALYYGTYISQYRAREIIDPTQQQDVWIPDNSGPIFDALRLNSENWNSSSPTPQYQAYLAWAKSHLQQGHPVVIDVFVQGGSDSSYDHIMAATGFASIDASVFHSSDTLVFNDNYDASPYTRTFGSLPDTRDMSGNGNLYEYCIPRDVDYGCAVTGIKDGAGVALPVSLKSMSRWDEPNISLGAKPVQLTAVVHVRSLVAGTSYALLRYDDYRTVPTSGFLSSAFSAITIFTARNSSHTFPVSFMSDGIVIYRCVSYQAGVDTGALPVSGDYDGDGVSDLATFCAVNGAWKINYSRGGTTNVNWGFQNSTPVCGDYDGDGRADQAVFYTVTGRWFIRTMNGGIAAWDYAWGWASARTVAGDYDGDGKSDLAVYDENTGRWFIWSLSKRRVIAWNLAWGWPGARPVGGDYDGDGKSDLAVLDVNVGRWYIYSVATRKAIAWNVAWGWKGCAYIPGDFDGDQQSDLAVYDQNKQLWFVYSLATGRAIAWKLNWGFAGGMPVSGDYDGDKRFDYGMYNPSTGGWYVRNLAGRALVWGGTAGSGVALQATPSQDVVRAPSRP